MTSTLAKTRAQNVARAYKVFIFALKAGGTAKTSTTTALAVQLGLRGYRVLVIDLDPQCNATRVLGRRVFKPGQKSLTDVMADKAQLKDIIVQARYRIDPDGDDDDSFTEIPNVWIAPGDLDHPDIDDAERILNAEDGNVFWLKDGLDDLAEEFDFDVVLIDPPATYGRLTVTALVLLDEETEGAVIPPVLCTYKEADALVRLEKKLKEISERRMYQRRGIRPQMKYVMACAAPTASFGTEEHWETFNELKEEYGDILLPPVHWSGVATKIYRNECAVPILAPNSRPSQDYAKVATALGFPQR
ncbi:ParA family protein [Streptomyces sp. NPDC092370]|uniref:ParA family protein n=1 Tax=Streptomyces sp. NPDC092370 TaxID=3366016 RepID=UPI003820A81A